MSLLISIKNDMIVQSQECDRDQAIKNLLTEELYVQARILAATTPILNKPLLLNDDEGDEVVIYFIKTRVEYKTSD